MYAPGLTELTAASSRCNSAADCHLRPGSSSRQRFMTLQLWRSDALPPRRPHSRARHHFVEHAAECIDVGTRISSFALALLRRHIGGSAHDHTAGGDGFILLRSSQAKIENFNAGSRNHDVAGFEIAVNDAVGVCFN